MATILISASAAAQPFPALDKSPMDMAYFPDNFAHDRGDGDRALVRITYSRPAMNGRKIFGSLVPFGKIWRLGANEATEIKFYADAEIGGTKLKAGTYSVFAIPGETEWTIVFSSDLDYWGAYSYEKKNDVARAQATVKKLDSPVENFSIMFGKAEDGGVLMRMAWDDTVAELPIRF